MCDNGSSDNIVSPPSSQLNRFEEEMHKDDLRPHNYISQRPLGDCKWTPGEGQCGKPVRALPELALSGRSEVSLVPGVAAS